MRIIGIFLGLFLFTGLMAQMEFPELKYADIEGAPKLSDPFLVMGETGPVMPLLTEKLEKPCKLIWPENTRIKLRINAIYRADPTPLSATSAITRPRLLPGSEKTS